MILKHINYSENKGKSNYWEIKDVTLSKQNLIVGVNATGKTRLMNVMAGFAATLSSKLKHIDGNWDFIFGNGDDTFYHYYLSIENSKVIREEIIQNDSEFLLKRDTNKAEIYSEVTKTLELFYPPSDEVTVNIRRDTNNYPFLEFFIKWAKNFKLYSFSQTLKNNITIPNNQDGYLDSLNTIPYIINKYSSDSPDMIRAIIDDMRSIGYSISRVSARNILNNNAPANMMAVILKEEDLSCDTDQINISDGMFRALCVIGMLEYILHIEKEGTIVIDDLGEGLDFERSSKLMKLLYEKTANTKIQLIITSNDRFLINSVDMRTINYLSREGHKVAAANYDNNKEIFDTFLLAGLNNFDFIKR
jgi:predicted ATPase